MTNPLKRLSLRKRVTVAVWMVNVLLAIGLVTFAAR